MKILSIESSAKACSAAITENGRLLTQYYSCTKLTHSKTLLKMSEDMLSTINLSMQDIDGIAVAYGPGSFTGIRIGVALAKGLAWGAGLNVCGVSTLEAMVNNAVVNGRIVCPVMDARRNEVYNALFKYESCHPVRLCEDRPISLDSLLAELVNINLPVYLLGDGAELCYNYFLDKEKSFSVELAPENLRFQSAWGVAKAAENYEFLPIERIEPVYLRMSQAERERKNKEKL